MRIPKNQMLICTAPWLSNVDKCLGLETVHRTSRAVMEWFWMGMGHGMDPCRAWSCRLWNVSACSSQCSTVLSLSQLNSCAVSGNSNPRNWLTHDMTNIVDYWLETIQLDLSPDDFNLAGKYAGGRKCKKRSTRDTSQALYTEPGYNFLVVVGWNGMDKGIGMNEKNIVRTRAIFSSQLTQASIKGLEERETCCYCCGGRIKDVENIS